MLKIYTRAKYVLLLLLACGSFWQGCNVINPAEPTPTYIHIDSFSFKENRLVNFSPLSPSDPNHPPTLSHSITTVWVYYNNNPVGIFDLPCTFPVIAHGNGQLEVSPGVIADGENNDVLNYPFYEVDTFSFAAQPGQTIVHNPVTEYYTGLQVYNISNFEDGRLYFAPWQYTSVPVTLTPDSLTFEGLHSGEISITAAVDSAVDSTYPAFPIPAGQAYIEFDYNSTVPFYVGLQGNLATGISTQPFYLTGIHPNYGWQKFYLEVDGFTAEAQATSYNFYIKAVLSPGQTSGRVLIDNIQLVTF